MFRLAGVLVLLAALPVSFLPPHANGGQVASTSSEPQVTAEEVLARYVEAIGGVASLKEVNTRRMTYWVHMFGREAYQMEQVWTRPDTLRTGAPDATSFTMTEGDTSWRVNPEGRRQLPAAVSASLSKLADIDGPFVDPHEKGIALAYAGVVLYDLTNLHKVTLTFSDGVQWECYFDAATGLLRRLTRPSFVMLNNEISRGPDTDTFYYDYRAVGPLLLPHYWVQASEDHTHLFVVQDIQLGE
jgi:hypothetical protein